MLVSVRRTSFYHHSLPSSWSPSFELIWFDFVASIFPILPHTSMYWVLYVFQSGYGFTRKCLMHQLFMPPLALQCPSFLSSSRVLLICGSITSAPSVSVALKGIFFLSRILNVLLVSNVFVHIVRMFSECVCMWVVLFAHTNKARMYRQHFYS